jgi:hypothetical protein
LAIKGFCPGENEQAEASAIVAGRAKTAEIVERIREASGMCFEKFGSLRKNAHSPPMMLSQSRHAIPEPVPSIPVSLACLAGQNEISDAVNFSVRR